MIKVELQTEKPIALQLQEAVHMAVSMSPLAGTIKGRDAFSPFIGEQGTWMCWDDVSGQWVDTRVKAAGTNNSPGASVDLMGTPEFDEKEYEKQVHHITAFPGGRLEFSMHDGSTAVRTISTRRRSHTCTDEQKQKMSLIMKKVWEERHGSQESNNDSADADTVHGSTDC